MNKQEQIEEMAKDLENTILGLGIHICGKSAEKLYDLGYRKGEIISYQAMIDHSYLDRINQLENRLIEVRTETAKEILQKMKEKCKELENKFSHICKSQKECLMETCRYEGVLAVKREVYELAKEYGVEVEE